MLCILSEEMEPKFDSATSIFRPYNKNQRKQTGIEYFFRSELPLKTNIDSILVLIGVYKK